MAQMVAASVAHGMTRQKVLATVQALKSDDNLGAALLVALGTLFLLLCFAFYPIYLVPLLAAAAGWAAYRHAPLGTIAGLFIAFPAIAYQAPVLAWVFTLVLALALFEVWEHWSTFAFLEVAILAPFAPAPFSLISGFLFLLLAVAAFRFGSKHSFAVSLPAIFVVLLLSALWLEPTNSFITISLDYQNLYGPQMKELDNRANPAVEIGEVIPAAGSAMLSLLDFNKSIVPVTPALAKITDVALTLLGRDFAIPQLIVWALALFVCAFLPAQFNHRYKQSIAALSLFLIPIASVTLAPAFNNRPEPLGFAYCAASVGVILAMEHYGLSLSREKIVQRKERQKAFGKFGLQDLGDSEDVQSLADVGGYEDVKRELHEAIIAPLRQKEISYTYGIKPPNGILLFGPPGTGKTLLMKALAKEMDVGFYYVKCSDLLSEWYGESLPYGEKILVMEGGAVRLEEIGKVVESRMAAKVLSFGTDGRAAFTPISGHIKHRRTSPLYEVRTRTGRRIRVTGCHSLFALDGCAIREVKTSELVPGVSHVAIPSKIPHSPAPVERLEFLRFLRANDFGLKVGGAQRLIRKAVAALGEKRARELLGIRRAPYLRQALRRGIGVRAARFLRLMEEARVEFDAASISVFAGKSSLQGSIAVGEELSLFLGLWVAEGSYNNRTTVRLSASEREVAQAEALCRRLFGNVSVYRKKGGKGRDIYIGSRALYVLMHEFLQLEDGAEKKKAPGIAFSFSEGNSSAFLRGYFSGDGTVYPNQKGFGTVEASTVSRKLAEQLLYLLLQSGIVATVYERKERRGLPASRICMAGEQLRAFSERIGFAFEGKASRLAQCRARGGWHRGRQVPITGSMRDYVAHNLPDHLKCGTAGAGMLGRIAQETGDEELSGMLRSDIHWDKVEEVRRIADEEYVYDIAVQPCQNFAGGFGGIFAHNSEKNVAEVFAIARKKAPCVLFFDEIDSVGKKRDSYTSDDVAPRIMSVLLEEMDGFKGKKQVITIGATNLPDQLDPALMRPGRFDKIIYMPLPDKAARKAVFKVHLSKLPTAEDIDYDRLAALSERYSGADIKNICTEASRLAAREAMEKKEVVNVTMQHLVSLLKRIKPSTSLDQIETYGKFRMDFERRAGAEEKQPDEKGVRWSDVAGLEQVRQVLLEAIELPLLHEDLMKEMDVKPSKGMLLFGPPGCGKTMIVKAAANELNANFLTISGAELMNGRERNPASYVKQVFNRARESAPALIFIDEIEALAPSRDEYRGGILTELLQEIDGVKELKNVMIIGATNKPSALDSAILRPGRFDKILYIPPPDEPARRQLFTVNLAKFLKSVDVAKLAKATDGFSGADIASVCQEVKMGLVRDRLKGKPSELSTQAVAAVIATRRPSITQKDLRDYFSFMEEYGERK